MRYEEALERAASLKYHHQWLDWRTMGWVIAATLSMMAFSVWDLVINNNPHSWAEIIGLAIVLLYVGALALLDWVEYRHMSAIYGRIRMAAYCAQAEQAKNEGKLH